MKLYIIRTESQHWPSRYMAKKITIHNDYFTDKEAADKHEVEMRTMMNDPAYVIKNVERFEIEVPLTKIGIENLLNVMFCEVDINFNDGVKTDG